MFRKTSIDNDLLKVFETVPDPYLILSPDLFIITASNAYLEATLKQREDIAGKYVFDAFPDNPATPLSNSVSNLKASLNEVLKTGKPHQMALQRYDIPLPGANGGFEKKYWQPMNTPVLDEKGAFLYIIHKAIDVTRQVEDNARIEVLEQSYRKEHSLNKKLATHGQELTTANEGLIVAKHAVEKLNSKLEDLVQKRTNELILAQQETERQRSVLNEVIMEAPSPIAIIAGREMVYQLVNPAYQQSFPGREVLNKTVLEAFPELAGTQIPAILDHVYCSGETFVSKEMPLMLSRHEGAPLQQLYWTFTYQARHNQQGDVNGILVFAHEVTEQVLARKKAEESEHQVRSIIESSPSPLGVYVGKEMRIQFANKAIKDIWGKGPDLIGKRFRDVLPELEGQSVFGELDYVFETGIPFHSKHSPTELLINGQLKTFYFNYIFTPLFNASGEVYGIITSGSDDTELILAQQRLEESESRFRNMIEQAPIAIGLSRGRDHFIETMNTPMLRIVGRNKDEIVGKNLTQAMPETRDEPFLEIVDSVLQTGEAYTGSEVPISYKLGENTVQRYFNLSYTPLKELGEVTGVLHVAVDVTEQVEGNKIELKRFKFMADQARDSFILIRKDGSFAYLNTNTLESWGYNDEEMQHLHMADIDPVYDREAFMQLFAEAQKEAVPQFEALHKTKGGDIFPVEVNVVGLTLGETPYLFAIARDITRRKQAEQEMEVSNSELKRMNSDLDNFIYTASHDLKAPIHNIEGLLHALLQNLSPDTLALDENRQITSMMQESVDRFKKTIANLTDVVKLQKENSGEAALINLSEVIEGVRLDLEQVIQSSGAEIEIDIAGCPSVHFSEKNLRSVMYNLLSNAIKYRSPGRAARVQISCKASTDFHVLSVKDNGLGMEARHVDQLFGMFKRFHADIEGSGIGLFMAKKMIENAGGRIEVESTLGIGTTFQVFFPYSKNK
ncbi:PAS domain-containing protein [Pontibacter locisalis]|uniref:histidine kinase n=1 Tax=Pontibacter locisalis TaxID=1719035 RepID=A0ABW5IJW8_9BACT